MIACTDVTYKITLTADITRERSTSAGEQTAESEDKRGQRFTERGTNWLLPLRRVNWKQCGTANYL